MNASDRQLIHESLCRLADGDRGGFEPMVEALWPAVLQFARRALSNATDAEDVAQEVFVRLCARISEFDRTRDGLAWALGIASYEVMTVRLRTSRRRESADELALAMVTDGAPSPEVEVSRRELDEALRDALGALPEPEQRLLTEETTGPQSATVRKRRQRALARLRELWRSLHG